MENDLRLHVRITIDTLRKSIEFERSYGETNLERTAWQLQGVSLLTAGVDELDDLRTEIESIIADISTP